jgi:hypothetical protein
MGPDAAHDYMQPLFNMFTFNPNFTASFGNMSKETMGSLGVQLMSIPGTSIYHNGLKI